MSEEAMSGKQLAIKSQKSGVGKKETKWNRR